MERIITHSLKENLIERLADFIEDNFIKQGKDISRLAFVFGGRRPALFLKRELSRRIKRGFLSPRFFSMDEFVEYSLSKKYLFSRISDLDACFIIYEFARQNSPDILKERSSFSRFLPWAREIFDFIEQLDLEDIQPEALKNIQEKAAIGYDVPADINNLLKGIISIREAYQLGLKERGQYCRGLGYLLAAQQIKELDFGEFEQIIFSGFFYLHKTEEEIIRNLYASGKATLFFQGSSSEWSVLDRLAAALSSPIEPKGERKSRYNLSVQCGFDVQSQVGLVREILKKTEDLDNTVIVLPEPDNAIALLSEIASCVNEFNISLGYPLKRSALYSLCASIFRALLSRKNGQYYAKDYLRALSHPLVKNLKIFSHPSVTRVMVHKIEEILLGIQEAPLSGSLFFKLSDIQSSRELYDSAQMTLKKMDIELSYDELKGIVRHLHNLLFLSWENINNFYDFSLSLERFLNVLVEKSPLASYPLNLRMAQEIFSIKDQLKNSSFSQEPFSREELFKIFEHKLDNEMVSFSGSPLGGLQVLGLFETRSLNFKNVIIMDVNEAVLPNLKIYEPLIPREVMISLGLNRLEKEEEIQRYHFLRLIAQAKNVYLLYQERPDKEKSRFIEELVWAQEKEQGSFGAFSITTGSFAVKVLPKRLEIKKNAQILKFLRDREYSASSLNTYMHCPLRFYYQYVLGLREKEDLLEEAEGKDIGIFIHELLRQTFAKFIGSRPYINDKFEKYFFKSLDEKFSDEFERRMKSDAFLLKEILDFRLKRFLDNERRRLVSEILSLEKAFKGNIPLKSGAFRFQAIIDRIDRLGNGSILILDYKTGNTDILPQTDTEKIASAGSSRQALKNTIKSFQLPLYLYFVMNSKRYKDGQINACLYSLKDIDEKSLGLSMLFKSEEEIANKGQIMRLYLGALDAIIAELVNPGIPFQAGEEDLRQCSRCPFFYMCR